MKRWLLGACAALACAALSVGNVRADDDKTSDVKFVKEVNQINLEEVHVGKLAQQRSVNAAIKKYGEHLASDHAKMRDELTALAHKKSIDLPKDLDTDTQEKVDRLAKLNGAEFDRAFTRAMIAGHEKAIQKFEMEIKNGRDSDVKAWAEKRIVTLREHLEAARTTLTAAK
jgi:putative membrane protein